MNEYAEPYILSGALVIKQNRKRMQLTQHDLAKQCNIPLSRFRAYENAMMPISSSHIQSIAMALDISVDMFVYLTYTIMLFRFDKIRDPYYLNLLHSFDNDCQDN